MGFTCRCFSGGQRRRVLEAVALLDRDKTQYSTCDWIEWRTSIVTVNMCNSDCVDDGNEGWQRQRWLDRTDGDNNGGVRLVLFLQSSLATVLGQGCLTETTWTTNKTNNNKATSAWILEGFFRVLQVAWRWQYFLQKSWRLPAMALTSQFCSSLGFLTLIRRLKDEHWACNC
jgi:hypothetical protein